MPNITRRDALRGLATGGLAGIAGCSTSVDGSADGTPARTTSRSRATGTATATPDSTEVPQSTDVTTATESRSEADSAAAGTSDTLAVGKSIRPAVVVVTQQTSTGSSSGGTGWFVGDDVVVTNSHVVGEVDTVTCWTLDGTELVGEVTHRTDYQNRPYHDVATVRVDGSAPRTLSIGDESDLERDQQLVQVGHPFNVGNWVIATGEYVKPGYGEGSILSTIPDASGNSGSPVVTLDERVVGLTTGSVPKDMGGRREGGVPQPVEAEVYESYPSGTYATHNAASTVRSYLSEWDV